MIIVYFQEMLYDTSSEIQAPFDVTATIKQVSVPPYVLSRLTTGADLGYFEGRG